MASRSRKVIITCAPTGAIHTPSMSPFLPVTADQIAEAGIAAVHAGAAILHLHARDPADGRPTQDPEAFRPFLERLHAETNAVINLTSGGSPHMTIEDRMRPAMTFKPEVASLNMGSMNFGLFPMLERFREFKYDWEREHLEKSRNLIFKNTFQDIETILHRGTENGTRFEFECYDISHLYNLAHFLDRKLATPPLFVLRFWHSWRHRPARRGSDAYAANSRPLIRRRLSMVDPWCWEKPITSCHDWRCHGVPCSDGTRGFPLDRSR